MSGLRIALFRNDGSTASVAHADLPALDSGREPVIQFNAFRTLQVPEGHALRSKTSSNPVYTNDMVYWAVHGASPDVNSVISVWRMDRHFVIAGVDRAGGSTKHKKEVYVERVGITTTLNAETWWGCVPRTSDCRPAVVVDGKIITVCCAVQEQLHVSQKNADGPWADVIARTDNQYWFPSTSSVDRKVSQNEARSLVMLPGSSFGDSIHYTYRFVSEPRDGSPLQIDMMKNTNLVNLRNDNTLGWYKSTVETHIAGSDHAYIITHAENGESHQLLYFDFASDGSYIYCRWITLKKDGFIDREKNEYHPEQKHGSSDGYYGVGNKAMHLDIAKGAPGTGDMPWCGPSSRQIMAFTWTATEKESGTEVEKQVQNLLLMWHTDLGYAGIAGNLDQDGGIPPNWQWKNMKVYKHGEAAPANSYDLYGVLVAKDFC